MHIYLLIHTIKSPLLKRKLENHLSGLSEILSYETEAGCYSYDIQTGIRKKELIKSLRDFVQGLHLEKDERVVLYDSRIQSDFFELPDKNEKIILNGDIEKENQVEGIILEVFRYIMIRMELEEIEKKYLNSITNNTHLN